MPLIYCKQKLKPKPLTIHDDDHRASQFLVASPVIGLLANISGAVSHLRVHVLQATEITGAVLEEAVETCDKRADKRQKAGYKHSKHTHTH